MNLSLNRYRASTPPAGIAPSGELTMSQVAVGTALGSALFWGGIILLAEVVAPAAKR